MPQQTKTEALEQIARLIRRDILNGEAPLNGVWWFDDDTKMQDRIAHVLLDYSDEEKPTGPTLEEYNALTAALTEKCAALVVENKRLSGYASDDWGHPASDGGTSTECGVAKPERYDNSTLRIDPDMSDPQPGKLLVVRLDADDIGRAWTPLGEWGDRGRETQNFWPEQRVGFLVETPAVEVKRAPKVGDKVRFVDGSNHQGIIGEVLFKYDGDAFMVGQGSLEYYGKAADLEVIA